MSRDDHNVTHDVNVTITPANTIVADGIRELDKNTRNIGKGIGNGIAVLLSAMTGGLVAIGGGDKKDSDSKEIGADDAAPRPTSTQTASAAPAEHNIEQHTAVNLSSEKLADIKRVAETEAMRAAVEPLKVMGGAIAMNSSVVEVVNRQDTAPVLAAAAPERDTQGQSPTFGSYT